ncbi:hypothetical protein Leryth_014562 [Lithospermum erythrorhizon]|nr:hypothetical protein Leryth_014562 [Lithospermum erythrorhizon]
MKFPREVECACGLQFCFNCLTEAHSPCSCLMWRLWTKKSQDESETVNWLTANTKYCPKCHKPVEKNGGCNLVTCVCGQHFCWLCGGATGLIHTWSSIEGHSCGRYKEDQDKKADLARKKLFRYTHYYSRFKANLNSSSKETELKEKAQEKVGKLQARFQTNPKDFSWVGNGIHRLMRSRRILTNSYPFAYFMFGDELLNEMTPEERQIKQNLFEDHQQQLEANLEKLSKVLEEEFSDYSDDNLCKTKMRITALSDMIDKFCRGLYEFIDNDLLGPVQAIHIAPYTSNGAEKAATLHGEQPAK